MNWRLAAEIALVLYLVWMLLFAWAAYTAPSGWEDDDGFHGGKKDQ